MKNKTLSIECYKKLNRSSEVAEFINCDLRHRPMNGVHLLYIPHIFSYIHDDIAAALDELKEKGLCGDDAQNMPDNADRD